MTQKIKLAQILQQYTGDQETIEVEGSTVHECLNNLVIKYPEIKKWIFDPNDSPLVIVLLNKELVLPGQMDKKVTKIDYIELVPLIAGG
jgi:molybdopterin synthase sulfur carrier subunit